MECGKNKQLWLSSVFCLSLSISAFKTAWSGESEKLYPVEGNNYRKPWVYNVYTDLPYHSSSSKRW
jgi:hypothetical protein